MDKLYAANKKQLKLEIEKLNIKNKSLEEIISSQKLEITYLKFDVEATTREKIYLRKLLDENNT